MLIELSQSDAALLRLALERYVCSVRVELAHTEAPALRHALAADLAELETLSEELAAAVEPTQGEIFATAAG